MKKIIIFFIVICGVLAFLYFSKLPVSPTNEVKKQERLQLPAKIPLVEPRGINKISKLPDQKSASIIIEPKLVEDNVTNSYPIEDAEIYFVPPEQRYPGNLGGPPPLEFPDP